MAANSRTSNARKSTPPARRAAVTAPVEPDLDDYEDDAEGSPADAQQAEAAGHYVTALLAGEEIRVIPPGAWRQSWQAMLSQANFAAFAEHVIHPDDLDLYDDIDPTNDEFEAFVVSAANRAGESLGKSRGPGRSSRRTRRR
ncbi:hypothetical protein ACFC0S_16740 [Streptomyces sp. NPDC056084]|uniref:hypothetical protein n=1 Tax=unclassified Streptomyces TaxID=2593676 RepID=UPI0035D83430